MIDEIGSAVLEELMTMSIGRFLAHLLIVGLLVVAAFLT